jgi:ketosteroid isomerase-like protein
MQRLAADYSHGVDKRDMDRSLSVWHPDAVWEIAGRDADAIAGVFTGHDEIRRGLETVWRRLPETHTWITNIVIDVNGSDHATGLADASSIAVNTEGVFLTAASTFRDEYEQRDGRWRYSRRSLYVHYLRPIALVP